MCCGIVAATDDKLMRNEPAPVSILSFKSHRMARAASATMAVEANALSEGLAEVDEAGPGCERDANNSEYDCEEPLDTIIVGLVLLVGCDIYLIINIRMK